MKKPKAPRVPVLENAFEVNLPKLLRAVKASGRPEVVLVDGDAQTVALVTETRLAVYLGGRTWMADIVPVPCLKDRLRPLLKCPRAHEGNFQSLYWRAGELACRHCHELRYRSNLAAGPTDRLKLVRLKLSQRLGGSPNDHVPPRQAGTWRKSYLRVVRRLGALFSIHNTELRARLAARSGQ